MDPKSDRESMARGKEIPLWELGFRPFFLGAMVAAPLLMGVWIAAYLGIWSPGLGPVAWHGHEMIFGYAAAVLAGFLLTASANWAERPTARGAGLAALFGVWLLGRAAILAAGLLPGWLPGTVDVAFFLLLAGAVAVPLARARQWRNLILVPVVLALAGLDAATHLRAVAGSGAAGWPLLLAVYAILLMIAVIGGRVIPFFTERAIAGARPRHWWWLDLLAIATLGALAAVHLAGARETVAVVAGLAAVVHALRWWGWLVPGIWSRPMLWVLFLGYGWLVVGFGLLALAAANRIPEVFVLHAWTAGAIGVMTLGMMVRVTLGHTGRSVVRGPRLAVWAFALVNVAVAIRVFGPLVAPADYPELVILSGSLWSAAFILVLACCGPMLVRPRATSPGAPPPS